MGVFRRRGPLPGQESVDALSPAAHGTDGGVGGSTATRSGGDEFAHGKSSLDDGYVLPSDRGEAQDCGGRWGLPFRSIRGAVADSLSWAGSRAGDDRVDAAAG